MKKFIFEMMAIAVISGIVIWFVLGLKEPEKPTEILVTYAVVTEVEFHPSGYISVAQIDPEWRVKTDKGITMTSRHQFKIGDTIIVKTIKYGK